VEDYARWRTSDGGLSGLVSAKSEKEDSMLMDVNEIQKIIPHRYPFLLVDAIVELEPGKRIVGIKNVTVNESFFAGHFPGAPVMPGVLIIEAMAQVGAVLVLKEVPNREKKLLYFAGIDQARFRYPVVPGDQLRLVVEILKLRPRYGKLKGEAFVGDRLVAEADVLSSIVDRSE
jgi:3-hydroxyacyl-[acyl-carrier-protein] dehydratase